MREYMLSFVSDDIDKMTVFDALHSAGLRNFVVTETKICNYENWKKDVDGDCAENAQTQNCAYCKYISCHLNHGAIYCKLYGERDNSKACKSFVPDSEV